ncbi:MAG: hypothetical protein QM777_00695 [Pseudorhodoferax sp.]
MRTAGGTLVDTIDMGALSSGRQQLRVGRLQIQRQRGAARFNVTAHRQQHGRHRHRAAAHPRRRRQQRATTC